MKVNILRKSLIKKMNVKGQEWETLIPWLIALLVIFLMLVVSFVLSGKGQSVIEYIKNLFRFGK